MHQAFYRKYRPRIFDDVCGQEHITSVLKYEASQGRVSHAYLFCGSRGTGKTTCAKILAKAVNCENPKDGNPCGECPSCRAIDSGSATDVVEMDAASNNGVDSIRELRDEVVYTPSMLKKRVYIIDEVHMLSVSAFNALLKTLEEPPEYVVFILATTELQKLPATIISRCQRFDFRRIAVGDIVGRLMYIAGQENIVLERDAAQRIARMAEGGMRDAVSLFELCAGGGADVNISRVTEVLGLSGYDAMKRAALSASSGNTAELIEMIAEVQASSKDITVMWQEMISFWRDMLIMKISGDPVRYLDLTDAELDILRECAAAFNVNKLMFQSNILDEAQKDMARSPQNKRTVAEFAALRLTSPSLDNSTNALLARIAELEDRVAFLESGVPFVEKKANVPKEQTAETAIKDATAEGNNMAGEPSDGHMDTGTQKGEAQSETYIAPETAPDSRADDSNNGVQDDFMYVPDVQSLIEKLGTGSESYRSFLAEAKIEINGDGSEIRVTVSNGFAKAMLESGDIKNSISRAALLSKLSSGLPNVEIVMSKPSDDGEQTDIFGL